MSDARRVGDHPNQFSREIRSLRGGGTVPDAWDCRVIDIDELYAVLDGELLRVKTSGRVWAWYRHAGAEVVAVAELKTYGDLQQSWDVTRSFALRAQVAGFRVVMLPNGRVRVTDLALTTDEFDSTRDFIERCVRPLIEDLPF